MSYSTLVYEQSTSVSERMTNPLHRWPNKPAAEQSQKGYARWSMGGRQGNATLMGELP